MALNITIGVAILLVATIPQIMAAYISIRGYLRTRYRQYAFMAFTWLVMWMGTLLIGLAYLTLNTLIYRMGFVIQGLVTFGIMGLVDSVALDHVDSRKLIAVTAAQTALVIYGASEVYVTQHTSVLGEVGLEMTGPLAAAGSIVFILSGAFWLYYMALIDRAVPQTLKKYSRTTLIGAIIAGPGSIIAFASGFVWIFPGTDYLMIGIGAFLTAYAFTRQPKLGYVLRFKVFRLMVFDSESGIPIYTYTWDQRGLVDSTLFSGALTGITNLLNESLSRGAMRDIIFERGVLLIRKTQFENVALTLLSTKSTPILREGLDSFAEAFVREFEDALATSLSMPSKFQAADHLIDDAFPFVVAYEE
ncbi:MAG: hypothetical protein K9W43_04750 [Candidatus Thorarchaeota archaeon]|nr:hypothetical protein [Candidatus Thorarchaeota archaeon]